MVFPPCAHAEDWKFDESSRQAYDLVLNLQLDEARKLIPNPSTVQHHYVIALAETIELLITEDRSKFSAYELNFKERVRKKFQGSPHDHQFFLAEAYLHWTFVYLKFGHEFDAATSLREAYQLAHELRQKNSTYLAIRKTCGLLDIMIGSVPQKYNWLLTLLGMNGSIAQGVKDLNTLMHSDNPMALEATFIQALVDGYIFQKPDSALLKITRVLRVQPTNRIALLIAGSLAIKASRSEEALRFLTILDKDTQGLPIHYGDYLKAEVYLHKADYAKAIATYQKFINHYAGEHYIKDAYYKIGLCQWLNGNANQARIHLNEAIGKGKEVTEADKAAARSLDEIELPHIKLSKVRYFTDGGYYGQAEELLNSIEKEDIPTKRNNVEYYYRKARLAHKTGNLSAAKLFYNQTIEMSGEEAWYFAPNSCLQMGFILESEGNNAKAVTYYERALRYDRHEYKNSIDSKAKSALERLR